MAEKKIIELEVKERGMDEFAGKAKTLKAQLREMKDLLGTMDEDSDAFKNLQREAGALQDKIGDINQEIKNFASDTRKVDVALQGINAAAGAFGAVQGGMALFGGESEELQKSMVKLQAAMTLVNSVQAIQDSLNKSSALTFALLSAKTKIYTFVTGVQTGATVTATVVTKALRIAMLALPIVAIIAGIAALAGMFGSLGKAGKSLEEQNDDLTASYDRQNAAVERNIGKKKRQLENELALIVAQGGSIEKQKKVQEEIFSNEEQGRKDSITAIEKQIRAKVVLFQKEAVERKLYYKGVESDLQKTLRKEVEELKKQQNEKLDLEGDYQAKKAIRAAGDVTAESTAQKEANDKAREKRIAANEKAAADKKAADEKAAQVELDRLANLRKQESDFLDELEAQQTDFDNRQLTAQEREVQAVNDKYFALIETATKYNLDTLDLENQQKNDLNDINVRAANEEDALRKTKADADKAAAEKEKQLSLDVRDAKVQMASDAISTLSILVDAFSSKDEASQRRAFKINKAASIAQASISAFQAANAAMTSPANNLFPGQNILMAGLALAGGFANVKKIAKTEFGGGVTSASSGGGGSGGQGTTVNAPSFNVVGNSGINQLGQLGQTPIQAYVVSGEVTSQQALDRNRLQNATL